MYCVLEYRQNIRVSNNNVRIFGHKILNDVVSGSFTLCGGPQELTRANKSCLPRSSNPSTHQPHPRLPLHTHTYKPIFCAPTYKPHLHQNITASQHHNIRLLLFHSKDNYNLINI